MFPELDSLPHSDTIHRLLTKIDVNGIESVLIGQVRHLIKNKKFQRYLVEKGYLIAIDGTQKMVRDYCWDEECLERSHEKESQFYAYVLEANLVFANGMTLPLFSEFLEYQNYEDIPSKQDCELKAFYRLATRIKAEFPRLAITVLLDGLYANGPVIALCRRNNWGFMIVLKDKSLPSVWREANGLHKLQTEQTLDRSYGNRRQHFWWVNDVVYEYLQDSWHQQTIHVL